MKRPAFQFYPADWRKDSALQSCSLQARGLWIELVCVMHECDQYGHLSINNKPMNTAQIARLVGESEKVVKALLGELDDAGVFSTSEEGCIYSRRMVKDEHLRNIRADAGRLGGNPNLLKQKDNQTVNQDDKQSLTPSSSSSSSTSVKEEPKGSVSADKLPPCPRQAIVDLYHQALPELPAIRIVDDKTRGNAISNFWKFALTSKKPDGALRATDSESALAWTKAYFERASENDFLMGRSGQDGKHRNWKADLDFLMTTKGMKHVIERTGA